MQDCNSTDIENGTCFDCGATNIPASDVPFPPAHKRGVRN